MSVRGFNTGSGIEQYDYDYLDNKPATPTKESIGLGNVDNTSDMNKPVSTAQAQALSQKVDKVPGMGLSQEDYTSADKEKLGDLPTNAELETTFNVFDDIPGTTQTVNFGADGKPSSIIHTQGSSTVRSDVFTWTDNTVTEVRTLADGTHITYVTNLETLVTTISAIEEAS